MSIRRLALLPLMGAGILAVIATLHAQFPKVHVPKAPAVPGVATPATPAPAPSTPGPANRGFQCSQINEDLINKYLKAQEVKKKVHDEEMAKANAKKAEADALAQKRGTAMMSTMMSTEDCKDKFKEKDPRSKEIARLENLVAAADEKGDEVKSNELRKKLDPLTSALDVDADRACGGKGSAALHDCMEKRKAALARQGVVEPMLTVQAQGECMQDPTTSGMAGLTAASQEEEAATAMANQARADAEKKANQAEADALGLDERDRGLFFECIMGVLREDPVQRAAAGSDGRAVILKHSDELKKALGWM
jgi:hypothetical protein